MLNVDSIVKITKAPPLNVQTVWPLVQDALVGRGIDSPMTRIAAIATIAVETPKFYPVEEKSNGIPEVYFKRLYFDNPHVAHALGNASASDAIKFHGRGLIQLTGRDNYELYGSLLDLPLDENPNLLLDPAVSAKVLAEFFYRKGINSAANVGAWKNVRIRVNGGLNGWDKFYSVVTQCLNAA